MTTWSVPSCSLTNVHVGCGCSIDENIRLKDQLRISREALEVAEKDITDIWQFGDTQLYDVLMKIRKTLAKMGEAGK